MSPFTLVVIDFLSSIYLLSCTDCHVIHVFQQRECELILQTELRNRHAFNLGMLRAQSERETEQAQRHPRSDSSI